jgi:hypothetical protein
MSTAIDSLIDYDAIFNGLIKKSTWIREKQILARSKLGQIGGKEIGTAKDMLDESIVLQSEVLKCIRQLFKLKNHKSMFEENYNG